MAGHSSQFCSILLWIEFCHPLGSHATEGNKNKNNNNKPLAWDVTVCSTVAASYMTAASQSAGAAAEQAAERKCLEYAELSAAYEFQPGAVETHRPTYGRDYDFFYL